MSSTAERVATLEAIAYGADPRVSPSDRMRALEMLDALPGHGLEGAAAWLQLAGDIQALSGAQLEEELEGFFQPGHVDPPPPPPPPGAEELEELVKRRVRRAIRSWAKRRGTQDEKKDLPQPAPAEPDRIAAEDFEDVPGGQVVRMDALAHSRMLRQQEQQRLNDERRRRPPRTVSEDGQIVEHVRAGERPPGMPAEAWAAYADELDGV